jgi:hypothetical protein
VPSDAERLLTELAAKLPDSQRFTLATTQGGRAVSGIRIGPENAERQVWVNARNHAWESGGSQVGRGFIQWWASDAPEAVAARAKTCLHFVPIMDVDNAALGAGGKEAVPRDHNRDWSAQPLYPEVAAAQQRMREIHEKLGLDLYLDLHNPGAGDPTFFFGPFGFERMPPGQQASYQRWIQLAAEEMKEPHPVAPRYRFATYVTTDEERNRMSSGWARSLLGDSSGISITLETGWNSAKMTEAGYGQVGASLGKTLTRWLDH